MGYLDLFYFACQDAGLNLPPPSSMKPYVPSELVTTEQIQKYLEENHNLIQAILECQNQGKVTECNQLKDLLQKNLANLSAIADAQPPPSGPSQVPPSPVAHQQSNYMMQNPFRRAMMQHPPHGEMWQQQPLLPWMMQQQLLGEGISKVPRANASRPQDQQQLLHFQQQQQIFGQMAMRARANNMHGMNQILQHGFGTSGSLMDARGIKKDSSEAAASADGKRKNASGRGNREAASADGKRKNASERGNREAASADGKRKNASERGNCEAASADGNRK